MSVIKEFITDFHMPDASCVQRVPRSFSRDYCVSHEPFIVIIIRSLKQSRAIYVNALIGKALRYDASLIMRYF